MLYTADAEDLLHEAITRTLTGTRKWNPQKVDILMHLKGCIRSIAYEYAEEAQRRSGTAIEEHHGQPFREDSREESIFRQLTLEAVCQCLEPHVVAFKVFLSLYEGFSRAEVKAMFNLDENQYNAARRTISRCLHEQLDSSR